MNLLITIVAAGVLGTLVMDALNYLFARTGLILKIDVRLIGRMTVGWVKGRFRYAGPDQMEPSPHERSIGLAAHYGIGLALAAIYCIGWNLLAGEPISALGAVVYGFATTAISEFFVYPSMGLGVCGCRSPERMRAAISPLANHLFFGIGMACGVALTSS
ncbi:DUF2938 family protein [candidate division GN15 bacterium]|nr:DUF2938 family protein [candidate division GN15 bacterium]